MPIVNVVILYENRKYYIEKTAYCLSNVVQADARMQQKIKCYKL